MMSTLPVFLTGFLHVMRMDILELLDTGQRVSRVSALFRTCHCSLDYCKLSLLAVNIVGLTYSLRCVCNLMPLVKLYTESDDRPTSLFIKISPLQNF